MSTRERRRAGSTEQLLAALLAGHTIEEAARRSGMSYATARRRVRQPDVRQRLDELRGDIIGAVSDRLTRIGLEAVLLLGAAMSTVEAPWSVRVRAAEVILRSLVPVREQATVEDRLAELEQVVERQRAAQGHRWAS